MKEENMGGDPAELLAGKFKSVDALVHAYGELESEFTRRSQRLKALEEQVAQISGTAHAASAQGELPRTDSEEGEAQGGALLPPRGVPLMTSAGTGVAAPVKRPNSIREAGELALGYLKSRT